MPKKSKQIEPDKLLEAAQEAVEIEKKVVAENDIRYAPDPYQKKGLVAYAAFDCNGEHYEPGDEFTPPAGWTRDANYDEFRGIQIKNSLGKEIGRAFNTPSGLQIVPVKEA